MTDEAARKSLNALRSHSRRGTLSALAAAVMADVDPLWALSSSERLWAESLAALDLFLTREGHSRIDEHHREGPVDLGRWAWACRRDRNAGRMPAERVAALERRPLWRWSNFDDSFTTGLQAFDRFAAAHGHGNVPEQWSDGDFPLGKWVGWQRAAHAEDRLSAERQTELDRRRHWVWSEAVDG